MSENKKQAKPLGFALVFWGLLFFFNPYFAVVDFLPDFIGCILVLAGLDRVATFHRPMKEARAAFIKLLAFDFIKSATIVVLLSVTPDTDRPVTLLGISFVSAILGFYFSYSAMVALFDGFYNLAATGDCPELWTNCRHKPVLLVLYDKLRAFVARCRGKDFEQRPFTERSRTEHMLRSTLVFIAIREVVCTLPEFTALSTSSYIDSGLIRIYDHIGIMRFFAFILVLVASIVWVVKLSRYFVLVSRQGELRKALGDRYAEFVRTHPGVGVTRRFGTVFVLFAVGGFLLCDFYVDFKNVIPDVLGAALFLLGIALVDLPRRQKLQGMLGAVALGAVSMISSHFSYQFNINYSGAEISKTTEAASAYQTMWLLSLLELAVFLAFLAGLLLLLRCVIRTRAGYLPQYTDGEFEKRRRAAFLAEFDSELLRVFLFGFLSAVVSFLYDYIKEIPGKGILRLLEFFWALDFSLALLFGVMLCFLLSNIHTQIKQRFVYDE